MNLEDIRKQEEIWKDVVLKGEMLTIKLITEEAKKEFHPMQAGDVYKTSADVSELQKDFDYSPSTTLEKGIGETISQLKN